MAHAQQLKFVSLVQEHFVPTKDGVRVLEVGSHDVNGSIRKIFEGSEYLGVDLFEGPGVDVVASGHELDFPDGAFDITISSECFEHNPFWVETFANMHRMTADAGVLVMTCASRGRLEHGTTRTTPEKSPGSQKVGWDYYKNLDERDFSRNFDLSALFTRWVFFYIPVSQDLYFVGWKGTPPAPDALRNFVERVDAIRNMSNSSGPIMHFLAALERSLLSPLTLFGDRAFQSFMVPYSRLRRRMYRLVRGR
ncbi:MAG: class I SAM-dependent methyltransferase [Methyloversatilis sp.]|uniref:class I SAM-dependent methyltransferase n=1 Tax=Methyloversatilis sp. TaxID=2569862 RepID=UPI0025F32555|nr:class I SAM-dependent methyltransferase [Methyloversatilis sp.]MCR6664783.1 class I SAM-dependent methyltransferase [Methyloversatilis sp.]